MMKKRRKVSQREVEFWRRLAWLMPRPLAYWCFVRVATYKCDGGPDDRRPSEAMEAWWS